MNDKKKILLVEDDSSMGFLLADYIGNSGFDVTLARNGSKGLQEFNNGDFDLCILDVMMPDMDGFTLASNIKTIDKSMPIIFLTARSLKPDKIKGFALGADDYITKPFDEEELLCRIQAVLNRSANRESASSTTISMGRYTFDWLNQLLIFENSDEKRLTKKECDVLKMLCLNKGKLLTREKILVELWGENDYFHGRSLDVFIAKLRKYLQKDETIKIENVPSVGFVFNVE